VSQEYRNWHAIFKIKKRELYAIIHEIATKFGRLIDAQAYSELNRRLTF